MQSHIQKNWGSELKNPVCNSDDTDTALFSHREAKKYGFHAAKRLFNSTEGLGAMSFSEITQQLKARLKANMCFCAFPSQG